MTYNVNMRVNSYEQTVVHIYKSRRHLVVLKNGKALLRCTIGLGLSPKGRKVCEGDGRTPEGIYYVCTRNAQSRYTLFLGISYPCARDAKTAYRRGGISRTQFEAIHQAQATRLRPPWDTSLGGEIGIHGSGALQACGLIDNTAGCIALLDADIRALWEIADLGTRVHIHP